MNTELRAKLFKEASDITGCDIDMIEVTMKYPRSVTYARALIYKYLHDVKSFSRREALGVIKGSIDLVNNNITATKIYDKRFESKEHGDKLKADFKELKKRMK